MFEHIRKELFLMVGAIATALTGANDALDFAGSGPEFDKWAFYVTFFLFAGIVIWRVLKLHEKIDDYEKKVTVTAKIANLSINPSGTDDDKVSLHVTVIWEVWSAEDVSVDRLALNMIYDYGKGWWQFWKRGERQSLASRRTGKAPSTGSGTMRRAINRIQTTLTSTMLLTGNQAQKPIGSLN